MKGNERNNIFQMLVVHNIKKMGHDRAQIQEFLMGRGLVRVCGKYQNTIYLCTHL